MNEPKIRFKGFEGEWKNHTLSESNFHIIAGGDVDKKLLLKSGKYPVVANALTNEGIVGYYENSYRVEGPAVTVTGRGEIGFAVARHYSFTPIVRLLSIKSNHNVTFLANAINCCKVAKESTGVPQLTTAKLQEYCIATPNKNGEEKSIASYFTHLDSLISASTSRLASLKQVKEASLQAMFPQEGETVPKIRFKGFEGEWMKVKLGDVANFSKGNGYSKNDLQEFGHPIILYGRLYTKYQTLISEVDTYASIKNDTVFSKGNEIIMPASGETPEDIARASAVQVENIILGGDLNVMRFDLAKYSTLFIALAITYTKAHYDLSKVAQGKSVVHLQNKEIGNAEIMLPSFAEQQKIASYFTALDHRISLQTQRLEKLKQIKAACLDKMFV